QPRAIDVRVDLRRGDAGVAQQLLHLPQVCAAGQQMRGKAVTERVRADVGAGPNPAGIALHQLPNRFSPQSLAAPREQHPWWLTAPLGQTRPLFVQVLTDGADGSSIERRQPVLAPFTMRQAISLVQMHVYQFQM